MARRYYNLPPLTTLAAFEAAARHLSFKEAAQELSVTPGAVSHQIKTLEADLGAALFRRGHRAVELTQDGEALFQTLASSFAKVSQCLQTIRARRSGDVVTIGSTSAVAALWLSPSVIRFWRKFPNINVNQVVQDRLLRSTSELDLFIRYGPEQDPNFEEIELYRDQLVPVASPALAETFNGRELQLLAHQRLIHLESEDQTWTTWADWFKQLGYNGQVSAGTRVNNYAVALQVAQDGAGVALGWKRLVSPLIRSGHLVPIGPHALEAPLSFYIVCRPDAEMTEASRKVRDWIVDEIRNASD
jgi:LysR family glycine cleavage system transcriptional activator